MTAPAPEPPIDFTLDLRGESCPYPVIHTLEALDGLAADAVLEVVTDCPQAFRNIPDEVVVRGGRMITEPVREGAQMTFLLSAGADWTPRRAREASTERRAGKPSWIARVRAGRAR